MVTMRNPTMKVKEGMYMRKILEAIKNFFSASHEKRRKGIQATKHGNV